MTVTSSTLYADFAQYESVLTEDAEKQITQAAEEYYKPCHMLTLDEFWGLVSGNFELLGIKDEASTTVFQFYWIKRFKAFVDEFAKASEKLAIKDENANAIAQGCVNMQPQEHMLIFARDYFGLTSFAQAGHVTIGEYMLARKDRYNSYIMRKNNERIQLSKIKNKKDER